MSIFLFFFWVGAELGIGIMLPYVGLRDLGNGFMAGALLTIASLFIA